MAWRTGQQSTTVDEVLGSLEFTLSNSNAEREIIHARSWSAEHNIIKRFLNISITSMGSTSWEMITSLAFFCVTWATTLLIPCMIQIGFWVRIVSLPAAWSSAFFLRRNIRATLVSGRYLFRSPSTSRAKYKIDKLLQTNNSYHYESFFLVLL